MFGRDEQALFKAGSRRSVITITRVLEYNPHTFSTKGKTVSNMKNLNVALIRVLQFAVFVLFTFMVLVYFGTLLLIPLDALAAVIGLLNVVGVPGVLATVIAVPLIGYLGWTIYRIPDLCKTLVDIGVDLVLMGQSRVKRFDQIVADVKG